MGEETDYIIDRMLDEFNPFNGVSSNFSEEVGNETHILSCKLCGKGGLNWGDTPTGYRLFDKYDEMHLCIAPRDSAVDDFRDFIVPQSVVKD